MKRTGWGTTIGAAVMVALLAGCGAQDAFMIAPPTPAPTSALNPTPLAIHGSVLLAGESAQFAETGLACAPGLGYADIDVGAQVTVTDETGKVLGAGTLEPGTLRVGGLGTSCSFSFTIEGIELGGGLYGIHVGNESRGVLQFTERKMQIGPHLYLG